MKKTLLTFASGLLMAQAAMADPAIYRDGNIFIPYGAHDKGTEVDYYQNIYLRKFNAPGFFLIGAEPGAPQAATLEDEPAIYSGGEMWVNKGANIYGDGRGDYYQNIVLRATSVGTFQIASAERLDLVTVDSVSLAELDNTYPPHAILNVSGTMSNTCAELEDIAHSRTATGSVFTVLLAESAVPQGEACMEQPTAFNTTVALPVCNCEPGNYTVSVNGVGSVGFTVPSEIGQ